MPALSTSSQALLARFAQQSEVTADHMANLEAALRGSPVLARQFNEAVAEGHLTRIEALPSGTHAAGTYSGGDKTIHLPLSMMKNTGSGAFDPAELTFVLGYELQHGFNHAGTTRAYAEFLDDVADVARSRDRLHDHSAAVDSLVSSNRRDEAAAHIAGWNAVLGQFSGRRPEPTLEEVSKHHPARMKDFIDVSSSTPTVYSLKPGLILNADLSLSPTPTNLEAMGQHYFDKHADDERLGHNGTSDYANYYGAYAATVIGQFEQAYPRRVNGVAPQVALDMSRLRLDERLMEENGIDLGSSGARQAYVDSSSPASVKYFDHTAQSHQHVPIHGARAHAVPFSNTTTSLGDLAPLDRQMHQQIAGHVARLDAQHGRSGDAVSARMAASLLVLAREQGLTSADRVVLSRGNELTGHGERIFVVQGALDDPAHLRASLETRAAADTPVEKSLQRLEAMQEEPVAREHETPSQQHRVEPQADLQARRLVGM